MSNATKIRPAAQADVDSILALMPRLADFDVPPRRNPEHLWMSDAEVLRAWAKGDRRDCLVQVAESEEGRIAGFSMVSLRPELLSHAPSSHLEAIAVAPGFERQGIGQRLLDAAERQAQQHGAESMTLHVFAVNDRARAMYEKAGFDGELLRYYKPLSTED